MAALLMKESVQRYNKYKPQVSHAGGPCKAYQRKLKVLLYSFLFVLTMFLIVKPVLKATATGRMAVVFVLCILDVKLREGESSILTRYSRECLRFTKCQINRKWPG